MIESNPPPIQHHPAAQTNHADCDLPGWCAVAAPIVRSVGFRLGRRYWLQPCDCQDLQQELWLELLVRHGGRDRADHFRRLNGQEAKSSRAAIHSQLRREIERIGAALVRSWPFWRRLRPMAERQMPEAPIDSQTARGAASDTDHQDLFLDVLGLVQELPAADRALCESLMADAPPSLPFDHREIDQRLAALRSDFMALGLHEYL